jgi:chemotaxis signal transduction protein
MPRPEKGPQVEGLAARIFRRYALALVGVLLALLFSILMPTTFATTDNVGTILSSQSVLLILTLAVLLPLRSGDFDLSVAAVMIFAASALGLLTTQYGVPVVPAVIAAIGIGVLVGAVNGFFIVVVGINAFIVTLATLTLLEGLVLGISGSNVITDLPPEPLAFGRTDILGLPAAIYYGWILAVLRHRTFLTPDEAQHLTQQEAIDLIFAPGFSTAEQVSDLSGRGVGMDVVRTNIQRLSGTVEVDTAVGRGTTFRLKVPLTLAIIKALLVKAGAGTYCLPIGSVSEALHLEANAVQTISGREVIINRGQVTPLIHMRRLFGEPERAAGEALYVVIISFNGEDVALAVDALIGQQEVVIKSLSTLASDATDISGATILADGGVGLIIDVPGLIRKAMARAEGGHI